MSLLKVKFGNRTYLAKYEPPLGYKGLVGLFYGNKVFDGTNYCCCNYLVDTGSQTSNCNIASLVRNHEGPLDTTAVLASSSWQRTFTFSAGTAITANWTAEQFLKCSVHSYSRWRLAYVNFPGWPYESIISISGNKYHIEYFGIITDISLNTFDIYQWNHIAYEYNADSNTAFLYINGSMVSSGTPTSPTANGPSVILPTTDNYYGDMTSQQMALWNKRISNGETSFTVPGRYMDDNGKWLF